MATRYDTTETAGSDLASAIRWGVLAVIRTAPNEQSLWLAYNHLTHTRYAYLEACARLDGADSPYSHWPKKDTAGYRVISAMDWARDAMKTALDSRPKWPEFHASSQCKAQLAAAKIERPENLTKCLETLQRLGDRQGGYCLYTDGDSFGFQASGLQGGLIWHDSAQEWSVHT